ncbi:PepSY domain-containing protein [Photobacterium chitinilyticum]|uniref:PepSY domain-containing protein n=1 Tax=Photobacterium chitinilyticum TaxID=2485123 RepID=A0A444JID6_9GAMM|nr:PepSY domain-containing protein [Photobacterium chitinilyticum]RWX52836.1 hypothetical protein EDI28_25185 [Photobacterium chitinilyticum]
MNINKRLLTALCMIFLSAPIANATPTLEIDEDHDDVMEAVQQGLIQPFSALKATVSKQLHGRIIKVELEEDDDIWVYELKLIDPNNNIVKVEYEAKTLSIIEIKGRNLENVIKVSE